MTGTDGYRALRAWRGAFLSSLVGLVLMGSTIVPLLGSSTELVRMRNSLLLVVDPATRFDWTPSAIPADYLIERRPANAKIAAVVGDLRLDTLRSDWERGLAIGQHLLNKVGTARGTPIQSDLDTTYRRIVESGHGYCGDVVDVFTALALAAGVPVRAWAFSFDGFGGHGHIFNEIWDRESQDWRMIDVFNNAYFVRADAKPLSALQLRAALEQRAPDLRMLPVDAATPFRYPREDKAWAYYRAGLREWYLWWGNNVFSYDRSIPVRALSGVSRSLEQLGAIAAGVHPGIRVLDLSENRAQVEAMQRLRAKLIAIVVLVSLTVATAVGLMAARWRNSHR